MSRCYAFLSVAALISALAIPAPAVILSPGDIVVTDLVELDGTSDDGVIFKVNPVTGDREIISGGSIGTGPELIDPFGILVDQDGSVIVSDASAGRIIRIDPRTGNREIISGTGVGAGPILSGLGGIIRTEQGLLVTDTGSGAVIDVDLLTGNRTIVSGPGIGIGPPLSTHVGIVAKSDDAIFVANHGLGISIEFGSIIEVDIASGDRTLLASDEVGTGPVLSPFQLAIDASGALITTNDLSGSIVRTDPNTGDRVHLTPIGALSLAAFGVEVEASGHIIVSEGLDLPAGQLRRFDPISGSGVVLSGPGVGTGPDLTFPAFIAIVEVPEPDTLILSVTGIVLILGARSQPCRRDRRR